MEVYYFASRFVMTVEEENEDRRSDRCGGNVVQNG